MVPAMADGTQKLHLFEPISVSLDGSNERETD